MRFVESDPNFVNRMQHPSAFDIEMFYGLEGLTCFEAKRGFETDLQVDFILPGSGDARRGSRWLLVLCMWHINGPRGLMASSSYNASRIDSAAEHLLGHTVQEIEIEEARGIARLGFNDNTGLSLFFDTTENSNGWSLGETIWEIGRRKGKEELSAVEAHRRYGRNGEAVAAYISQITKIPWFKNVGLELPHESRTSSVPNLLEASKLYGTSRVRSQRWRAVLAATDRIAAGDENHPLLRACFAAWSTAREVAEAAIIDTAPNIRYWISTRMALDAARAAHELVLGHLSKPPRYYRDLMFWYEQGHWPCETTEDGHQLVY